MQPILRTDSNETTFFSEKEMPLKNDAIITSQMSKECKTAEEAVDFLILNRAKVANLTFFLDLQDEDLSRLIRGCPDLTHLWIQGPYLSHFPLSEIRLLKELTSLSIVDCETQELSFHRLDKLEFIQLTDLTQLTSISLPTNLKSFVLIRATSLKRIALKNMFSIADVHIESCIILRNVDIEACPSLRRIVVNNCACKIVIPKESVKIEMLELNSINQSLSLPRLTNLFLRESSVFPNAPNLHELKYEHCKSTFPLPHTVRICEMISGICLPQFNPQLSLSILTLSSMYVKIVELPDLPHLTQFHAKSGMLASIIFSSTPSLKVIDLDVMYELEHLTLPTDSSNITFISIHFCAKLNEIINRERYPGKVLIHP